MSVHCAKTGQLIEGVSPTKITIKKRKVIYEDRRTGHTSEGWEIVKEAYIHPEITEQYSSDDAEWVGQVVRSVIMTKPKRLRHGRGSGSYENYEQRDWND